MTKSGSELIDYSRWWLGWSKNLKRRMKSLRRKLGYLKEIGNISPRRSDCLLSWLSLSKIRGNIREFERKISEMPR